MQASSQQLQRGAAHLRKRLDTERRFYAQLAQLQRGWNVQGTRAAARRGFAVDLALQPPGAALSAALVDLVKVTFTMLKDVL